MEGLLDRIGTAFMNALYLDVTSACQSVLNTGVKRIQRGLHGWLKNLEGYQPVCWQSVWKTYRHLLPEENDVLDQRNCRAPEGWQLYDICGAGVFPDLAHSRRDRGILLDWPGQLRANDVILIPDLIWDNRGSFFHKIRQTPAKKIGIFHDAIGLRRAWKSGLDVILCAKGVRALAAFDLVLCISEEAEADLLHYWKKWGIKSAQTRVVGWPVPFAGERPCLTPQFDARHLLYVARLEEHKNHLRLLEACELLWKRGVEFQLGLIGCYAYPLYSRKIRKRVESLRRQGRQVDWRPSVTEAELHQAYQKCSFTVFPSLREGFGLPILESLWHGRPVVCGTRGALGEVSSGGGCEPIDPEDVADISAAIYKLLLDPTQYVRRYEEIVKRPLRSWKDYWNEVSEIIRDL
jgi:glycosyltransferase involved in cell wall biosynthesis